MTQVLLAEAYNPSEMGSLGRAAYMLHRQIKFPLEYDPAVDKMLSADHDRLLSWDYNHFRECCRRFLNTGELGIGSWVRSVREKELFEFLKAALKADRLVDWTGCRVLGTVHRGNGYPVYTLQLFSNQSGCEVFSEDFAPNVKGFAEGWDDPLMTTFGFYHQVRSR